MELVKGKQLISLIIRSFVIRLLELYKKTVSPFLPSSCIYTPSCSTYARTALEKYGICRGGLMALSRLLRCTPFHRGGYDPVK